MHKPWGLRTTLISPLMCVSPYPTVCSDFDAFDDWVRCEKATIVAATKQARKNGQTPRWELYKKPVFLSDFVNFMSDAPYS